MIQCEFSLILRRLISSCVCSHTVYKYLIADYILMCLCTWWTLVFWVKGKNSVQLVLIRALVIMLPQYYFHDLFYKNIFHISFSFYFVYFLLPRNTQWYKLEEMIVFYNINISFHPRIYLSAYHGKAIRIFHLYSISEVINTTEKIFA